jgi:hypothetical protein
VEDFASALVLAMVRRSLARQSVEVAAFGSSGNRTVRLEEKQALLDTVLVAHGPAAILRVADIVPEFSDHPVAGLFAGCRTPGDVIASWLAIERYFHSRHRTRIVDSAADRVVMEHYDTRGSPISAAENLAVAGLILGILRWRGAHGGILSFGETATPADRALPEEETHRWSISWNGFDPPPGAHSEQHERSVPPSTFRDELSPIRLLRGFSPSSLALRMVAGEQLTSPARRGSACEPFSGGSPELAGHWETLWPPHACTAPLACWLRRTRHSRLSAFWPAIVTSRTSSGHFVPQSARRRRNTENWLDPHHAHE